MQTHRVFVYGTLKRGFENHGLLEASTFVGRAHTLTPYRMFDGRFPVLRDEGSDLRPIAGEVYDVDTETLEALDDLEGVAEGMYRRVETGIALVSGHTSSTAFIYVGCGDYWDHRGRKQYVSVDARGHLDWSKT